MMTSPFAATRASASIVASTAAPRTISPTARGARPCPPAHPLSAQLFYPAGDGPSDLVRRIFLEEMEPRDRHLGLRWQPAGEVEIRAAGDEQTGLGLHEQLGYTARRQPVPVGRWHRC